MQLTARTIRTTGIAGLVLAGLAHSASPDTSFSSKLQVYTDDDHTSVVSPMVEAQSDVTPDTNVSLGYVADAVTSASVDIVSQASPTTIHDTRNQVSAGVSHAIDLLTLRAGYSYSREHDYLSHTMNGGISRDFDDKNTTLALGYGLSLNTVSRANDLNFRRSLTVQSVSASWTQIVNPKLVTQVTYELAHAAGFQASPYRFVPIRMSVDASPELWVPETDPDVRWRHAIVVGANRAIGDTAAVQGDYRLYHDTWGITSHTIGARYLFDVGDKLEVRLRSRFYVQNGASFYQSVYTAPTRFISYDRELSPLWSETVGTKLSYMLAAHIEGELKLDGFYYSYSDFAPLASRLGANIGIGVSVTY